MNRLIFHKGIKIYFICIYITISNGYKISLYKMSITAIAPFIFKFVLKYVSD